MATINRTFIPPQVVAAVGFGFHFSCQGPNDIRPKTISTLKNFLCLFIFVVQFCCSCPVVYLFLFVIFFLLGGLQSTIVPDRPHWESNGRGKQQNKERATA